MAPNDGLFPNCCELNPKKAKPTFCGPCEILVFRVCIEISAWEWRKSSTPRVKKTYRTWCKLGITILDLDGIVLLL
jgi:hypothetical protein